MEEETFNAFTELSFNKNHSFDNPHYKELAQSSPSHEPRPPTTPPPVANVTSGKRGGAISKQPVRWDDRYTENGTANGESPRQAARHLANGTAHAANGTANGVRESPKQPGRVPFDRSKSAGAFVSAFASAFTS